MLILIARANAARDKRPHLTLLVEKVQVIELLMRLFKDNRFISVSPARHDDGGNRPIGKQANAWKRNTATAPAT